MKEEFTNASGDYCAFTDEGIFCININKSRFYPYGSITKISFGLGSLDIQGKTDGENKAFIYVAHGKEQKDRLLELINMAKTKMKTAPKEDVFEFGSSKTIEEAEALYKEHLRKKSESKIESTDYNNHNNNEQKKASQKKKPTGMIVAAAVFVLLVILPISAFFIVTGVQRNTIYNYKEAGKYVDAYRICAMMPKSQEIKDLMSELEPHVWAQAEELYLSGDVKGADLLIQKCNIDYNGYHYVLNGQYKYATLEGLTHIVIPDSTTTIFIEDFKDCTLLRSVVIPDGVTKIPNYAFEGCTSLENIVIPDSVTAINDYAFWRCKSLTNIEIPNSVTKIGEWAFLGCSSLESVTIPDGITEIEEGTFHSCESLVNVEIPNSVTRIGAEAFCACDSLTNIDIPDSVTKIGSFAFSSCDSLNSVIIPNGVSVIPEEAFSYCKSLTSVLISSGVRAIDERAFANCTSLKKVELHDGLESIWKYAFTGCKSLEKIVIPDSVVDMGNFVFTYCDSLTIYCESEETRRWGANWNGDRPIVWEYNK